MYLPSPIHKLKDVYDDNVEKGGEILYLTIENVSFMINDLNLNQFQ